MGRKKRDQDSEARDLMDCDCDQNIKLLLDVQNKAIQSCMQDFMNSVNSRMDKIVQDFTSKIHEVKRSLEFLQKELEDVKKSFAMSIESASKIGCNKVDQIEVELEKIHHNIYYLDNQSQINNLCIDDIEEGSRES